MSAIWNDIRSNFKNGSSYTRLLYINIGFFLVYKILTVSGFLFQIGNISEFVHNYLADPMLYLAIKSHSDLSLCGKTLI